ncbi:MAG: FGGY-family carbohydrate kinase, partial [bacterium]
GERTPQLPNARASLYGLSSTNFTVANLCRASMEGATFGLKYGLEVMRRQGISPSQIRLVGGGAKSKVWRQIVADIFDCPVICPRVEEAGALGAAIQAMWCYQKASGSPVELKEITDRYVTLDPDTALEPRRDNMDRYRRVYDDYLHLNRSLLELNQVRSETTRFDVKSTG